MSSASKESAKRRIQQLPEHVVNRIAAGEVIHRPASALKELLENSLDAGSTQIEVQLRDGGLKVLQISDNGHGIMQSDFEIVCRRHTTSKITKYSDLEEIETFGFRGEALASVSHVAHVTITSMTKDQTCAYRASFKDGELVSKDANKPGPTPCAGVKGTQIKVEDMFYNVPIRLQALRSPSEEYNRCLDVVSKYAVHNPHVKFSCKKVGASKNDINTMARAKTMKDCRNAIRTIYGRAIAQELLEVTGEDVAVGLKYSGLISNMNFSSKKLVFILFINNRLVECSSIRKALTLAYSTFLPKKSYPFIYLNLNMTAKNVDVNVHPTKREVMFLHEEPICESLQNAFEKCLAATNTSRVFQTQPKLAVSSASGGTLGSSGVMASSLAKVKGTSESIQTALSKTRLGDPLSSGHGMIQLSLSGEVVDLNESQSSQRGGSKKAVASSSSAKKAGAVPYRPNKLVRTDAKNPAGRLEAFLQHPDKGVISGGGSIKKRSSEDSSSSSPSKSPRPEKRARYRASKLTSVNNLIDAIDAEYHAELGEIFSNHVWVGLIDDEYALVQHKTKLYLLNVPEISEQYFYERLLRKFGDHRRSRLSERASLRELVTMALEDPENGYRESDGDKGDIANFISTLLVSKGELINEYFALEVSQQSDMSDDADEGLKSQSGNGDLVAIPELCPNYVPPLAWLPNFAFRLGSDVNWNEEQPCFETLARELARMYRVRPGWYLGTNRENDNMDKSGAAPMEDDGDDASSKERSLSKQPVKGSTPTLSWIIQNVLFPRFRSALEFTPPRRFANDGTVVEIAALENLYKIFERC